MVFANLVCFPMVMNDSAYGACLEKQPCVELQNIEWKGRFCLKKKKKKYSMAGRSCHLYEVGHDLEYYVLNWTCSLWGIKRCYNNTKDKSMALRVFI